MTDTQITLVHILRICRREPNLYKSCQDGWGPRPNGNGVYHSYSGMETLKIGKEEEKPPGHT